MSSLTEDLARLDQAVEAARERNEGARRQQRDDFHTAAREATRDLVTYRDAIQLRKADATPIEERPEKERELTAEFFEKVRERGLVLAAAGNGGAVTIVDPSIDREAEAANAALVAARRERDEFAAENAEGIEQERKQAEMERLREAIQGDDPDALADAIPEHRGAAPALTLSDV